MAEDDDGRFTFYDLNELPSWVQYTLAAKSLLKAIELDDPEKTMMLQLTVSEVSVATFGLIALIRMFPEFTPVANNLSNKIQEIGQAQKFLKDDTLDSE